MSSKHVRLDEQAQDLLFREAHTTHTFTDDPVTDEQLAALYDLVKWAPTSFNQQPLRVALIRSEQARNRLVPLMWDSNQDKVARAPLTAIFAADLNFHELLPKLLPLFPDVVDAYFSVQSDRVEAAQLNATLQVGYFILGVRALGMAAGPMTGFDAEKVTEEFFDSDRHRALVIVNLGTPGPDAYFPRQPRLEFDRVFTTH